MSKSKMNFDRIMTIYLYKSAQVLLLFYCLTPTDIECTMNWLTDANEPEVIEFKKVHSPESYALIKRGDNRPPKCGAVWFSDHSLLTSASCLTRNRDLTKDPYIEVKVIKWIKRVKKVSNPDSENVGKWKKIVKKLPGQKKSDQSIWYSPQYGVEHKGEAIVHPFYKMDDDGLSFGYDLAVVRVDVKATETAQLCSQDTPSTALKWIVFSPELGSLNIFGYDVYHRAQPEYVALSSRSGNLQGYYIDPHKQFTTYSSDIHEIFDGVPIFDFKKNCVAGIKNFDGVKDEKTQFITSTKVYPVIKWIEHTRHYLKKTFTKSFIASEIQPGIRLTDEDFEQLPDVTEKPYV